MLNILVQELLKIYGKYMYLKIYIDSEDEDLKRKYYESINERNIKMLNNVNHIDAGFDLFAPENLQLTSSSSECNKCIKLDYQVICNAKLIKKNNKEYNTGFYMYPRSSISKSNLRLANNVGIIDAGYRGHLIGMFDLKYSDSITINKFDRYLQICAPNLIPIVVEIVNSREELGEDTDRGNGGFGSTGI